MLTANLLAVVLVFGQGLHQVSTSDKSEFIGLLRTLPTKGEFYSEEAVRKAGPYMPTLFSLTEADIRKYDFYQFGAISRGLCDQKDQRDYAVHHFEEIRHPKLKLLWAVMLFNSGVASPEINEFLKKAVSSKDQSKVLAKMIGPKFQSFKKRVLLARKSPPNHL